jgi:hypothetical protein
MRFYDPTKGATDSNRNIRYSAKGEAKWRRSKRRSAHFKRQGRGLRG